MDPVAHTLVGATLAETGLRRLTRYGVPTLLIGVNLPDIDAVASVLGSDMSLYLRRGWTHGVLAMLVLPALLALGVWAWHRLRGAPRPEAGEDAPADRPPPLRMGWIFALSYLATWSHPLLDWMNTYGVRLLMPFDGRWFYGDTLFIVDPWFWLLTAAGVVAARSGTRRAIVGWLLLGVLASALVLATSMVPLGVKIGWFLGLVAVVALRLIEPPDQTRRRIARAGFATLVLYIGVVFGLARLAESSASGGERALEVQASPVPGVPFEHRLVLVFDTHYRVIPPHDPPFDVPREEPNDVVRAALAADSIRGFTNWTRFPYWDVEEVDGPDRGWVVTFRDLRYVDPDEAGRGIGYAQVTLDAQLRVQQ